jgi:glucuronate isomerase
MLGNEMETGELPDDIDLVGKMIAGISYHNAKNYFNL